MFEIINKQILSQDIKRIDILAPSIAQKAKAGQFISVSPEEGDERIPLTVVDADSRRGTITLIIHGVGETSKKLAQMAIGESIFSILGPLGMPSPISKKGNVLCVATGIGVAQILPICRELKKAGNKVIGVIGAKSKKTLMLETQMRLACDKIFITTEDGSYEKKGLATDLVKELLDKQKIDSVYAIGSVDMMEAICEYTQKEKIETRVYLNPIMVDCMGMCGSCRVVVRGKSVLACIEGPEFDGHKVDFDDLKVRMKAFKESEWFNQRIQPNPKKNESATFTKFLSGLVKK